MEIDYIQNRDCLAPKYPIPAGVSRSFFCLLSFQLYLIIKF